MAWKRVDGEWTRVPCDPDTPQVCWHHKVRGLQENPTLTEGQLSGGSPFVASNRDNYTQLGFAKESFDAARREGHDLQRA